MLADDDELVRESMAALLSLVEGVVVVGEARHGVELLALVDRLEPDLVVTDLSMPIMGGLEAITRMRSGHPEIRAVVLSLADTAAAVRAALDSGALGYVCKDAAPAELQDAVRRVMAGGQYLGPSATRALRS